MAEIFGIQKIKVGISIEFMEIPREGYGS